MSQKQKKEYIISEEESWHEFKEMIYWFIDLLRKLSYSRRLNQKV